LGQDIQIDDVVFRGARDGNTSNFRLGIVVGTNEAKKTIRVEWKVEDGYYHSPEREFFKVPGVPYAKVGNLSPNTVFVVDKTVLDEVLSLREVCERAARDKLPAADFERITGLTREVSRY